MEKLFLELDEKTGEAFFDGIKCEITNRYYHADLQRGFEKVIGNPAWTIMHDSALVSGTLMAQEVVKLMKGKTREEILQRVIRQISIRGFGAPRVASIDWGEKKAVLHVENSYGTIGYGKTKKPVCHPLRGLIAGLFTVLFGEECECEESQCSAVRGDKCIFQIKGTGKRARLIKPLKPRSDMKRLVRKEVKYNPEKGEVFFDGVNSGILMCGRTSIFQRVFEDMIGPTSRSIIYEECKETSMKAVGTISRTIVKIFGDLTLDMTIKKLTTQIPTRGWGACEIVNLDKKKPSITLRVRNCYNHLYYGKTRKPACYSMASIIAGGCEIVFRRPMVCSETRCEALGDPYCEFVANPA